MAFFLTLLYARFVPAGGVAAGVRLGILVAFLFVGDNLITFAVQPLTTKILGGWIVGDLIQFAIAGAIRVAVGCGRALPSPIDVERIRLALTPGC